MQINKEFLIHLYEEMLKIRLAEETIAERYWEWKMRCPTHLSTGQEGVAAGVCSALTAEDYAMSTHRCHAHYLAKGGDLKRMIAELYGKSTGCSGGKGGSMHLVDQSVGFMGSTSIVGNSIPIAVGLGLSIKLNGTDQVSCVFFGEAAAETGAFYEAINFAMIKQLPVLFICENNLYSVYSPLQIRQPKGRAVHEIAAGLRLQSDNGDGNDVLEVHEKTARAVTAIRNGEGPQLLEFATYRWREHCGPLYDNDLGYRTESEIEAWMAKDPVKRMGDHMLHEKALTETELNSMGKKLQGWVNDAFTFAEESPYPAKDETYLGLYAEQKVLN